MPSKRTFKRSTEKDVCLSQKGFCEVQLCCELCLSLWREGCCFVGGGRASTSQQQHREVVETSTTAAEEMLEFRGKK